MMYDYFLFKLRFGYWDLPPSFLAMESETIWLWNQLGYGINLIMDSIGQWNQFGYGLNLVMESIWSWTQFGYRINLVMDSIWAWNQLSYGINLLIRLFKKPKNNRVHEILLVGIISCMILLYVQSILLINNYIIHLRSFKRFFFWSSMFSFSQ